MAGSTNNITIKLKVDGSEDAVRAVDNVKSSVDQITKAQADLIKQKTKEIELDGALRRSLEARAKIAKEDMQRARISEYKSMQEVLRTEREIGAQIKKRAGDIANSKRQTDAENSARRDAIRINSDLAKAEHSRNLENIKMLKEQENLRSAQHRAEINRIKAENAAARQQAGTSGDKRSGFFAPAVAAVGQRFGLSEGAIQATSKFLDLLGRINLAALVFSKVFKEVSEFTKQIVKLSIEVEKYELKMKSLEVVTRNASISFGQAKSIFESFNDGLQSEDAILTATRTFSTLGINAGQARELISGLRDGIVAMGGDVSEQLPLMALAFKRQESALLDNAGITANLDVMYKEYAKSIGTTVDKLTTQQKVQASVIGSLKELRTYQGLAAMQQDGLTGAFTKSNLQWERTGRDFAKGLTFIADFAVALSAMTNLISIPVAGAVRFLGELIGGLTAPLRDASVAMVQFVQDYEKIMKGPAGRSESIQSLTPTTGMTARRFTELGAGGVTFKQASGSELDEAAGIKFIDKLKEKREQAFNSLADSLTAQGKKLKDGQVVNRNNLLKFAEEDKKTRDQVIGIYQSTEAQFSTRASKVINKQRIDESGTIFTGLTKEDEATIRSNQMALNQDLIELRNRFYEADRDASKKTEEEKLKSSKRTFELTMRGDFENLQRQSGINTVLQAGNQIRRDINNASAQVLPAQEKSVALADAENKIRERIFSVVNKTSRNQYDDLKVNILTSKLAGNEMDKLTALERERALIMADRQAMEKNMNELRTSGRADLADEIKRSSGYISLLESQLRVEGDITSETEKRLKKEKELMEERVKSFKMSKMEMLTSMTQAHKVALVDKPEAEVDGYRKLINLLKEQQKDIMNDRPTDENIEKYNALGEVIEKAGDKLDEAIKDSFTKTVEIIQSGLEKTYSVIQTSLSGDFGTAISTIVSDISGEMNKQLVNQLSMDEAIRSSVQKSKDLLGQAIKPYSEMISENIAKPIINGINNILKSPESGLSTAMVGLTAGLAAWAAISKTIYDYFEGIREFAKEIQDATQVSITGYGREFKSQRGSIYGLRLSSGIASSDLAENMKQQDEQRKKMQDAQKRISETTKSVGDFIMSGFGIGTGLAGKDLFESSQKLAALEKQYQETQDAADKYNDQLNREEALKSSKEMLYDLDQQIAEMNIDNALRMGQITQEEADRQKKMLEIEQKRKDLTNQAIDIASGFVDQSVMRKYQDKPQQFQADLAAAVNDFAKTGNTKGLEALGITGEEITGPGGLAKVFEKIGQILSGMNTGGNAGANMPGSSPDKPMYTQVVNVKDFRLAFPDSAYFRAPAITTTSSGVSTLNGNRSAMGM